MKYRTGFRFERTDGTGRNETTVCIIEDGEHFPFSNCLCSITFVGKDLLESEKIAEFIAEKLSEENNPSPNQ